MTRRLPKHSHHDVKDRKGRASCCSDLAAGPASGIAALMRTQLSTGIGKAQITAVAPSLLMLETVLGGWTTLEQLYSSGPGQSFKDWEKRSPGAGDQGQLLMGSGVLRATGSKAAHTGGSCCWANDPNVLWGEAASHTRCFHHYESYQESGVYRERLKLSQMLFILGRKQ